MFNFIIDIFCKDTVIGLSGFENIRKNTIYKNKFSSLFKNIPEDETFLNSMFIGQIAYRP